MAEEIKREAEAASENKTEQEQAAVEDPVQLLRELCKGKLKLFTPIRGGGHDVTELSFDFLDLNTVELLDALDSTASINSSAFLITNRQAMAIFAATAGKCTKDVDAVDVMRQLSGVDAIKAIQLAKLFWNASHRAGNKNILSA